MSPEAINQEQPSMTRRIFLGKALALASMALPAAACDKPTEIDEISVMHWNVWMHEKKEHVLELIREHDPDIICMQELTADSAFQGKADVAKYLADALSYDCFHKFIPNGTPQGIGRVANGILSRMPIVSTDWQWTLQPVEGGNDFQQQHRLYVEATFEANGLPLTFGTTHMSYTDRFVDVPERKVEADALVDIAASRDSRYILTGDLNSTPDSYVVKRLGALMRPAGPDYGQNTWTTKPHSYRGFEETELNWRLDYVFATPDIPVVSAEIIKTDYSDHLPILVRARV